MTEQEPKFRLIILLPQNKWEEAFADTLEEARSIAERTMLQGHWKITDEGMELLPPGSIMGVKISSIPAPAKAPLLRNIKGRYL